MVNSQHPYSGAGCFILEGLYETLNCSSHLSGPLHRLMRDK